MSSSDQRRIIEQWRRAAPLLAEQRRDELRRLTPEQALATTEAILELLPLLAPVERGSGLVEQQRIFSRQV
jgi:hypothetical protein